MADSLHQENDLGQPIGLSLSDWKPPSFPPKIPMAGRYCRLEPLDPELHGEELFAANSLNRDDRNWTYLPYGPLNDFQSYRTWLASVAAGDDPQFYAVISQENGDGERCKAVGVTSFLRIDPPNGAIEVGHIHFSPLLQQTAAATEAMYLMMTRAFELGYRRYEWKCDALNAPSCRAAERLGFSFEGIFRQATVYKGRNRDTAWYSIIDSEWPRLKEAFEEWLSPKNFDSEGKQRSSLRELTPSSLRSNWV